MPHYVGLDVSQKTTAICVVDEQGKRLWRGVCATDPGPISARISQHAGAAAKVGIETGAMTPWLVHGLRGAGLNFSRSRAVGAHLGLTPRRYQSGETDRSGHISRCGDGLARTLMYEAATVILHRVKRPLHLKDWAEAIERRSGSGKARVALVRKLSVILHSVWRSGEPFRWAEPVMAA